jgi:hypothetical protein
VWSTKGTGPFSDSWLTEGGQQADTSGIIPNDSYSTESALCLTSHLHTACILTDLKYKHVKLSLLAVVNTMHVAKMGSRPEAPNVM